MHGGRGIEALHLWESNSQATAARERRCDCLEDMDNLVYDISFFLFIFFSLNTCSPKVLFSESLQRNLLNVEIEFEKKNLSFLINKQINKLLFYGEHFLLVYSFAGLVAISCEPESILLTREFSRAISPE